MFIRLNWICKRFLYSLLIVVTVWSTLKILLQMMDKIQSSNDTETFDEFSYIESFKPATNLGDYGRPVYLPKNLSYSDIMLYLMGSQKNAFNQFVSDLISVRRKLPDPRNIACTKQSDYSKELPKTSVIICIHNEAWSTLLRTVHSVLDRSPSHLLQEILLVDDSSSMPHLKQPLDEYMKAYSKVSIIRIDKRVGPIKARLIGFEYATGPVLTYLDSHCECAKGWLEPLLDRIARDPAAIVCPTIDTIDANTFEYKYSRNSWVQIGGFNWNMKMYSHEIPVKERKNKTDPVHSPTIVQGIFSINKSFFDLLGTYDSEFSISDAGNLELSFKVWMCGGILEIVPCSHVGHVHRTREPIENDVNVVQSNFIRLAKVWMDEYAKYYYQRIGYQPEDYNITSRIELRQSLNCSTFKSYLHKEFSGLFVPDDDDIQGEIRNVAIRKYCISGPTSNADETRPFGYEKCYQQPTVGSDQYWVLTNQGEIRRDEICLGNTEKTVFFKMCDEFPDSQRWTFDENEQYFNIRRENSNVCLQLSLMMNGLVMMRCNQRVMAQRWDMVRYDMAGIKQSH